MSGIDQLSLLLPDRGIRRGPGPADLDGGFSLVETLVGISMLALVLTTTTPLFINGLQSTAGLGGQQVAVTLASQQLEHIRSIQPAGLVSGRNATDVASLNSSVSAGSLVDLSNDNLTTGNSDPAAQVGSPAAVVKLTSSTTVASTTYTIRDFINVCYLSRTTGRCTSSAASGPAAFRIYVEVSWPRRGGVTCQSGLSGQCQYVATTIIDASKDPTFTTTPPPTVVAVSFADPATSAPLTAVHPGQQVSLTLTGTNFTYGATVASNQADVIGSPISNLGGSLTVPFTASSVTGARTFTVLNPNGTSGFNTFANVVKLSIPNVLAISPSSSSMNATRTFTLTGTDFFATPTTASPTRQPGVTMIGRDNFNNPVNPTISNVTVTSPTSLTFKAFFPYNVFWYTATGTLTLTNPDGATDTYSYSVFLS